MKKYLFFMSLIWLMSGVAVAYATNHYVRVGATGSADGSDWTNAYTAIPADPTHGDTYYLADGVYGDATFGDEYYAGSDYVTIKKATASDHGTATGWLTEYGDGQAQFTSVGIQGPYIIFDGVTGSDTSGYGIKIGPKSCGDIVATGEVIVLNCGSPHSPYGNDHIYVKHIEIEGIGQTCSQYNYDTYGWTNSCSGIKLARDPSSYIYIQNNYIHEASSNIHAAGWTTCEISDNYFGHNFSNSSAPATHGQQFDVATSQDVSVFNNTFYDSLTFLLGVHNEGGGISNFKFYNNIILPGNFSAVFAMAESGESDGIISSYFHHNTFVGVDCGSRGAVFVGTLTDVDTQKSYAYNNLFYDCVDPRLDNADKTAGGIVHDYNAFFDCTGTITAETHRVDGTGDPLVDSSNNDYRLVAGGDAVDTGTDLGSTYNTDIDGNTRPLGSGWDIGAYECTVVPGTEILGGGNHVISGGGNVEWYGKQ